MKTPITLALLLAGSTFSGSQMPQHMHSVDSRGDKVMGFSHEKTSHHFRLYKDGGAIQVTVNDPKDKQDLAAIRSHLKTVAKAFSSGDLSMPMMIHNTTIPGLSGMRRLHAKIAYRYEDIASGGSVRIVSHDSSALTSIHRFLHLQINDHRTADNGNVEAAQAGMDHADCPLMKSGDCPLLGHGK